MAASAVELRDKCGRSATARRDRDGTDVLDLLSRDMGSMIT